MKPVIAPPLLPYPSGNDIKSLRAFDADLRRALVEILTQYAFRLNGMLPADGSEPATLLRVSNNTDVSSLTQTDQPVQIGDYANVNMMIDGNEIQVRLNGVADVLNLQLLGGSVRIGSVGGSITIDGTTIAKNVADNGMVLSGGSSAINGANIELYGGSHATNPNEAYYDANLHTFRTQNAGALNAIGVAGVQFPATQIASGDANRLDDYEEGTWTPTIDFSGGSTGITYTTQAGSYVKIGQLVFYQGRIILSNKGSSAGNARIGGFPFTAANTSHGYTPGSISFAQNFTGLTGALSHYVEVNTTYSNIMQSAAGGAAFVADTAFTNATDIIFAGTYRAGA